jgi:hypothetical protein
MNFERPHYRYREGMYRIMPTDLTTPESTNVPDWARKASTGASLGNIDSSDLKPPRLKMLAGMSPEVMNGTPGASPGNFWITILEQSLGHSVVGTMILVRKSYQVWAPKVPGSESQKGPLASSSNGISWDVPNQVFDIRFPNNPNLIKWRIGKLVTDHSATKWGTQNPDDRNSKPIATLTYDVLWVIDLPNGVKQLCVFTNTRTGVTPTQKFISAVKARGIDQFYQRYRIVQRKFTGPTGDPYFSYDYEHIGNIQDPAEGARMRGLWEQYSKSGFVVDLEQEAEEIRQAADPDAMGPTTHDDSEIPF